MGKFYPSLLGFTAQPSQAGAWRCVRQAETKNENCRKIRTGHDLPYICYKDDLLNDRCPRKPFRCPKDLNSKVF